MFTLWRGGGVGEVREKVEGQHFTRGYKIPTWLTVSPVYINSIKHQWRRHFSFWVFIFTSSMFYPLIAWHHTMSEMILGSPICGLNYQAVFMFRLGSDVLDKARNVTQKCVIVKICLFLEDGSESQKRYSLFNLSVRFFNFGQVHFLPFFLSTLQEGTKPKMFKLCDNKIIFEVNGGTIK